MIASSIWISFENYPLKKAETLQNVYRSLEFVSTNVQSHLAAYKKKYMEPVLTMTFHVQFWDARTLPQILYQLF